MAEQAPTTWTAPRRAKLADALAAGLSYGKAAERLGVHRGSVCWAVARYGIGRAPANLSRAAADDGFWEARLTERWADRKKARSVTRASPAGQSARPREESQ